MKCIDKMNKKVKEVRAAYHKEMMNRYIMLMKKHVNDEDATLWLHVARLSLKHLKKYTSLVLDK